MHSWPIFLTILPTCLSKGSSKVLTIYIFLIINFLVIRRERKTQKLSRRRFSIHKNVVNLVNKNIMPLTTRSPSRPRNNSPTITRPKNLITNLFKVRQFILINAYKYKSIIFEKVSSNTQARVNHTQPIRMEPPLRNSIRNQANPILIFLIRTHQIAIRALSKIILIYKVIPSIIWRIYIYNLYLSKITFLKQLQSIKVIPFYKKIFRGIEIHTFFDTRPQCLRNRRIRRQQGFALARPIQPVTLLWPFDDLVTEFLAQLVEVHRQAQLARFVVTRLGHAAGEQFADLGDIVLAQVGAVHLQFVHARSLKGSPQRPVGRSAAAVAVWHRAARR